MPSVIFKQLRCIKQQLLTCLPCQTAGLSAKFFIITGGLFLSGCSSHKDFVDSTLDWTSKMRGGVIATQRPPPPGRHEPYPHVGLVPTDTPAMPSPEARTLLTEQLIRDKNLTHRTEAANGTLTPYIPPPPSAKIKKKEGAPALSDGQSGAIMNAADAPSQPVKTTDTQTKPNQKTQDQQTAQTDEVALPEVTAKSQIEPQAPDELPQIPLAPPDAPSFPGFTIRSDTLAAEQTTPNYDLSDPSGTALHFMPGTDQLAGGQTATLAKLAGKTPQGPFYIRASGSASSYSASDQSDSVQLGLLRAQRIANALITFHVPASAIHIKAEAFGSGAHVSTTP